MMTKIRQTARQSALVVTVLATLTLTGCASNNTTVTDSSTAESLYRAAKRSLDQGDFLTAIDYFETLGARYPFGNYTQQAQLDIAYAYFKQDEYDNAISSADRFIKLYPRSENVDYAYYMKGLSHFSRGGSFMERIFPRDMSKVNQNWLRSAYAEFDALIRRFPDSRYVPDSLERMQYLRDEMARHELTTAQFYYDRGAMVAAINRVTFLLEHFKESKHVPNALALMASAYGSMGQTDLKADTLRVLEQTAPEHPALQAQQS
ncbi:MAG: outer membrane protein assembly factor BamD [Gammaproteobacteria bacterium]|nr:outer membrane protein assembly factor BamD [Gammaproteobacteria bacterium]